MWARLSSRRTLTRIGVATTAIGIGSYILNTQSRQQYQNYYNQKKDVYIENVAEAEIPNSAIAPRQQQIAKMKQSDHIFDVLIIGGGATGAGCALDAATRGLSVALVEKNDFASGTSSRSTKLIHGGVRYLEKAFTNLDAGQLHLVEDALRERRHLINIAPHLSRPLPIIVPFYQEYPYLLFYAPYYWIGIKAYDFFAGKDGLLEPSYFISRREAREKFPMLKEQGLKGGVVYYDGQHNDARMNIGICLTAAAKGATIANHVEVESLIRSEDGTIRGAHVHDHLTGDRWDIHAKTVINATGPFSDSIRSMARSDIVKMIKPSSGVHIALSGRYTPEGMGLIIPETEDGRVLFLLPWEGSTIAGTTDSSTTITEFPRPHENEITFILKEVSKFLNHQVHREDVDAAWSGIRPLAVDPKHTDTASTSRDHVLEVTAPGLVTIAGGKWTTYRKMSQDTIDEILKMNQQRIQSGVTDPNLIIDTQHIIPCNTTGQKLIGAGGWSLQLPITMSRLGFSQDVADHLAHNYGDKAFEVARLAGEENCASRLAEGYPFIEAEVLYACRYEFAFKSIDCLAQRMRLAYLNSDAAAQALPRIVGLMAKEHSWDISRRLYEYQYATKFLKTMNRETRHHHLISLSDRAKTKHWERLLRGMFDISPFTKEEIAQLRHEYHIVDPDNDDKLTHQQASELWTRCGYIQALTANGVDRVPLSSLAKPAFYSVEPHLPDEAPEDSAIGWEEFLVAAAAAALARK